MRPEMEAVSALPRMLSRLYSTEPKGLMIVFSITLKDGGSPTLGKPGRTRTPVERLPLRGVDLNPRPKLMEFRLDSCTFTSTSSAVWLVTARRGETFAQSNTP